VDDRRDGEWKGGVAVVEPLSTIIGVL